MIADNPPATPVALHHDVQFENIGPIGFAAGRPEGHRIGAPDPQGGSPVWALAGSVLRLSSSLRGHTVYAALPIAVCPGGRSAVRGSGI